MILFEKDCSKKFTITQEQVDTIRNSLVKIIGQTKILVDFEQALSREAEKDLEVIATEALWIHRILEKREEEEEKEPK